MNYVFEPEVQVSAPVVGADQLFPVRRVYCVGRNYAAHAREMGFDPDRQPPFFFCKPDNSIVVMRFGQTGEIAYPLASGDYQHEIDLVVAIGKAGANISVGQAEAHVFGYAVGLDMTRRDLQRAARDNGRPWELGKAFDESAPIAPIHRATDVGHPAKGAIWVKVDGADRQRSDIDKLIWSVPEVIAHLSKNFTLQPGDVISSGTPEGVGNVLVGQTMHGGIDRRGEISVHVN